MPAIPRSPLDEIEGFIYFPRLCDKIRLHAAGDLHEDYIGNIGLGFDKWTCEYFGVSYEQLAERVKSGDTDAQALAWAQANGFTRSACETAWWKHYMLTRGFRDDMSDRLAQRKEENGWADRHDIQTFLDFIVADEA